MRRGFPGTKSNGAGNIFGAAPRFPTSPARELAGLPYQLAHGRALARRVAELEKQTAYLLRVGRFDAANDPLAVVY